MMRYILKGAGLSLDIGNNSSLLQEKRKALDDRSEKCIVI
jgi:hypothetical protein